MTFWEGIISFVIIVSPALLGLTILSVYRNKRLKWEQEYDRKHEEWRQWCRESDARKAKGLPAGSYWKITK